MANRFTYPLPPGTLSTGYDNQKTSDVTIPSCGIEDVDVALFELFDKELRFNIPDNTNVSSQYRKVPVIFAAGEKWAMLKNKKPIRDKTGSLILPLITIMRSDITQDASDINSRGINQHTGELVIRRRLDKSDRQYQNLINRAYLLNQKNVAVNPGSLALTDQVTTKMDVGDRAGEPEFMEGALLAPDRLNNVYEILTLPSPQFFTAKYQVTFWSQYTQQLNSMLELFISSLLPQGRCFRLETKKGYWFVANVDESYTQENNFEDMSMQERLIKHTINISVPAYVLASSQPGVPIPVKRFVSAPMVGFNIGVSPSEMVNETGLEYPYPGADDPTLPLQPEGFNGRRDLRDVPGSFNQSPINSDPASINKPRGPRQKNYMRIGNRLVKGSVVSSFNGETTYKGKGTSLGTNDIDFSVIFEDKL